MRAAPCWMLIVLVTSFLHAADDAEMQLKGIAKNLRGGDQEALAPLKELHTHKLAADTVLSLVGDKHIGLGVKLRLAEIVASWPEGASRKTLADWLIKHPSCDDDALMFFAGIRLLEGRTFFWNLLAQIKGAFSAVRDPQRAALAAKALGAFQDNPEVVVARIAAMLDPANAHVMRASAAEALGGMRSATGLQSLLPYLNDDAIGDIVHCSLFQLTGQDFANDPDKWKAWLTAQGANIPWKMLPRADYADFLKLQKLLKPLDEDPAMNMASFYGMEVRAKGALFILDVSGSMNIDGRIGKLKTQMSNVLAALQNKSSKLRYGILTFGEGVDSCFSSRGIVVNDEKNHKQAVQFVDRIRAEGGTPMCAAFTYALNRVLPDSNIDAIYFLSDGMPSDGTPDQVLELAQRIHAKFQTRIHTLSIGEGTIPPGIFPPPSPGMPQPPPLTPRPSLLKQIAEACGGTFTVPP